MARTDRVELLNGTLDLIVLRALATMGPLHAEAADAGVPAGLLIQPEGGILGADLEGACRVLRERCRADGADNADGQDPAED